MSRCFSRVGAVAVGTVLCTVLAARPAAQTTNFSPGAPDATRSRSGGWTITPAMAFATSWDDNVLMKTNIDEPVGANVSALNPRINADYYTKRTQLNGSYDGSFLMYQNLGDLNSYDQRASVSVRQLVNRRWSVFGSNAVAFVPTTELVAFVGVPFVRTGSKIDDAHVGVDVALNRRSSLTAIYNLQWVSFDATPAFADVLRGGHSQGATLGWKRTVTRLLVVTGDYDFQRATVTERIQGNPVGDFNIHNAWAGAEARLSPTTHAFAAAGIARVGVSAFGPPKTGPAWRAGLTYQRRKTGVDLSYNRSFVPSYSFGGTLQNEDVMARLRFVVSRKLSGQTSFSWRSNQSLLTNEPNLNSLWLEGSVGYALQTWLRLEGFYIRARQSIDRPGGILDRNRVGFQIVTSNPVRVR